MFPAQLILGGESRQFREFQVVQGSVVLVGSQEQAGLAQISRHFELYGAPKEKM